MHGKKINSCYLLVTFSLLSCVKHIEALEGNGESSKYQKFNCAPKRTGFIFIDIHNYYFFYISNIYIFDVCFKNWLTNYLFKGVKLCRRCFQDMISEGKIHPSINDMDRTYPIIPYLLLNQDGFQRISWYRSATGSDRKSTPLLSGFFLLLSLILSLYIWKKGWF